ncbi:MAG: hypothetical protein HY938_04300 [Nitrosomonadales bacterium]|nr:hypothetical protein [Nitrosomonadales bacterium]
MRFRIFFLAGALAAVVMAPQASATPVFARQTGMACSSCHFQHFPLLNGFGRAFKSAGFTMMGGQAKVEGSGLSIPSTLNMAVVTTAGYEKSNQVAGTGLVKTAGDGVLYVPNSGGELSLFFGGRISENAGFLAEWNLGNAASSHSSAKMPIQYDTSSWFPFLPPGTRMGIVPFATDLEGASYGFEVLNTGASAVHQMVVASGMNGAHSGAISAQQYIATNGKAKGVAFVVSNTVGFINLTKFDQTGISGSAPANLGSTYLRVAGIFELAGWDVAAGAQMWSGSSTVGVAGGLPVATASTKATAIDGQMQGHLGEIPVGFYASFATAPKDTAVGTFQGNTYNLAGTATKSSFNVSSEVGVVPDKATLGAAMRFGKSGDGKADNAIMLTGTYKLAQNMMASLSFTSASGSYWFSNATQTGTTDTIGNTTYTINLFSAF